MKWARILAVLAMIPLMGIATSAHADELDRFRVKTYVYRDVAATDPNNETGWWVVEYYDSNARLHQDRLTKAVRRTSGVNGTIPFASGEIVFGDSIRYNDGTTFRGCIIATSQDGVVTTGVINPNIPEGNKATYCGQPQQQASQPAAPAPAASAQPALPAPYSRVETGQNGTLRFNAGDRVVGAYIRLDNNRIVGYCTIEKAPVGGTVAGGYIGATLPGEPVSPPCSL